MLNSFLNYKVLEYDWYGHAEDYEKSIPQHEDYQYDKALVGDYTFDFSEHFHKVKSLCYYFLLIILC